MDVLTYVGLVRGSSARGSVGRKGGVKLCSSNHAVSSGMGCQGGRRSLRGGLFPCGAGAAVAEGPAEGPVGLGGEWGVFADSSPQPLGMQPSPKKYKPKKHKQMIT